ncbi:TetR/AcrR family transcriptional regulator [Erythrobacter mangrovi]|uniref:TetR/AcrR family transcriptional regulator n=1 Tax=Erythrobacter mangrovi TaxID=2739433 RepID=A0A7D3XBZ5_9SPHN|nr:TetR/AcrR family transcriptional regulator [Erythrobacter mangrovi]QKG72010.1 TetR/AcrR family transcriptional regulator [Erythrobacter mangrovi]
MATRRTQSKKTQQRTLDTRAAIMGAGAQLFATRGYAQTGVRDIAEAADCNQALVAYHFGSKGGLYDALLEDAVERARVIAAQGIDDDRPIRALVRTFARAIGSTPHFVPMLLREYMDPERMLNPQTSRTLLGMMALTRGVLAALPEGSPARDWDPQVVHLAIVGPLILFLVATPVRERVMHEVDVGVSTPTLDEFADGLSTIMEHALQKN